MKRSRFATRQRLSREATELQRLATGLAESGGKLEDNYWESRLAEAIDHLLRNGGEDDINNALDQLFETQARAHDELADLVEACVETSRIEIDGQAYDVQLFAAPTLAWSCFAIPSGRIPDAQLQPLATHLAAHIFADQARVALANYLFSPDQLPRTFCDTWQLTCELAQAAGNGQHLGIAGDDLPATNRFLSDTRYLVGAVAVPVHAPLFRWNEAGGDKASAEKAWQTQGGANLESLLTGSAWKLLLPDAYHSACRQADRQSRPYSLQASVAFLGSTVALEPARIRAVIGACYDRDLEEYRVGLGPTSGEEIYHGIVWPLLGNEDENNDIVGEIETLLREAGVTEITILDHRLPMEFCDDCNAPMFPNTEGELVHAQMPESAHDSSPQLLH